MEIRKLNHNTFDIFMFQGWDGWSRVRLHRNKTNNRGVHVVSGKRLSKPLLKNLADLLHPRFRAVAGKDYNVVTTEEMQ